MILFFFKQKTAYEMRISDWSSDVCSSDLLRDRWSEQIGPGDTPQNLTLGAGGDRRTEKRSDGSVDCAIAAAGYFMQRAEGEPVAWQRSEEHTSELQSLMRISSAVFCMKKQTARSRIANQPTHADKTTNS